MQSWRCSLRTPQLPQRLGQCSLHTSQFGSKLSNARRAALWGAAGVVAMAGAEQTVTEPVSGHSVVLASAHCHLGIHSQDAICSAICNAASHQLMLRLCCVEARHSSAVSLQGSALGLGRVQATGAQFPLVARFWEGDTAFRCMGAGVRSKKFGFIGVKVRHPVIQRSQLALVEVLPASDRPEGLEDIWQPQRAQEVAEQSAALMLELSPSAALPAH